MTRPIFRRPVSRRTTLTGAASLPRAGLLPGSLGAQAAWKPNQGMRIVVPAAPGGTTDIIARPLALQAAWARRAWPTTRPAPAASSAPTRS